MQPNRRRSQTQTNKTVMIVATIITVAILVPLIALAVIYVTTDIGGMSDRMDVLESDANSAKTALSDAEYQYKVSEVELGEAKRAYESADEKLYAATTAMESAEALYTLAVASYEDARLSAENAAEAYGFAKTAYEAATNKFSSVTNEYESANAALDSAKTEYANMKSELESANSKLNAATNAMNAAKTAYESAMAVYEALAEEESGEITVPSIVSTPSAKEVYAKVADAVLEIRNYNVTGTYTSLGSGFIFDKSGLVCTNYHVISGANELRAQYGEGDDEYYKVSYVAGFDKDIDLAIIKLEGSDFPTVPLATTEPAVGETIYALGSNTGFFKTFSTSIVAYVNKQLEGFESVDYIQYFSLTHSGNSGCPIFNASGEVIAVNQLGDTATGDHGFGIPIKYLKQIARNQKLTPMEATYAGAEEIDAELLTYTTYFDITSFSDAVIITGFKDTDDVNNLIQDSVVTFPSTIDGKPVKSINMTFSATDTYAMYHYYFVKHLVIPEGVTSLSGNVFYYAPETLLTVKLPSTLTSIGDDVFDSCLGIYRFYMPKNGNLFVYLQDEVLYSVDLLGRITLHRYPMCKSDFGEDKDSSEDDGEFATTTFDVPSKVIKICDFAMLFSGFTELNFPNRTSRSSLEIGSLACAFNENLKSVSIPQGTTYIGARAFGACTALESVTFEGDIETLGEIYTEAEDGMYYGAFDSCTAITKIEFKGSVTQIGDRAFLGAQITSLTLPNGLTTMGKYAFARCEKLITANCSAMSLTALPYGTFAYDSFLTTITFPNGITEIGDYSLSNCTALASITIPKSVKKIGDYAFYYDSKLKTVDMGTSNVESIGKYAFFNCDALVTIALPGTLTSIGAYAFSNCDSLQSLIIPEGVKVISEGLVFNDKAITSVVLPTTVTRLADGAFWACPKLEEVYFCSSLPPFITELLFEEDPDETPAEITIYLPSGSLNNYMEESCWRYFASLDFIKVQEVQQ